MLFDFDDVYVILVILKTCSIIDGLFIIGNMLEPTRIIKSKDDPSLEFESKPILPA